MVPARGQQGGRSTYVRPGAARAPVDVSVRAGRAVLEQAALQPKSLAEAIAAGTCQVTGDAQKLVALFDMFDEFRLMFDIVTPGIQPPTTE